MGHSPWDGNAKGPEPEAGTAPWRAEGPQEQALTQSTARRHLPERGEMGAVGM